MAKRRIAFGSWAFVFEQTQTPEFHDLVHHLQNLGYDGIELGCFAPHPTPDSLATKEQRTKFQRLVTSHGLEFSALVPDLRSHKLLSVPDAGLYLAAIAQHLELAADLGIRTMRVDTAEPSEAIDPVLMMDRAVAGFDACAKMAAAKGVTLAWEFEPGSPLHRPGQVLEVVRRVRDDAGNKNFGVLLNTSHLVLCSQPGQELEFLKILRGKIAHVHLADTDGTMSHCTTHQVPLGKGKTPFDVLLPELLASDAANDWWCIDLSFWPDPLTAAEDCKRYLDKLRKRLGV